MVRQTLLPYAGRRFDELSDHQRIRTEELHGAQKLSPNAVGSKRLKINYKSEALQLISAEGLRFYN